MGLSASRYQVYDHFGNGYNKYNEKKRKDKKVLNNNIKASNNSPKL